MLSEAILIRVPRQILWIAQHGGVFLFGQGLVQALTLAIGLLLVHVLTMEQYALYTIAGSLLGIVSLGSNFGLGQAIVSLGARRQDDPSYVGALWRASRHISVCLYPLTALAVMMLAARMFHGQVWPLYTQVICVVLVLSTGFVQINTSLGRSVFNMHHDASAIFCTGSIEALVRLILVVACVVWPLAVTALAANLFGAAIASIIATWRTRSLLNMTAIPDNSDYDALRRFVIPLVPMVIYTLLQGQIAVFLLSISGYTYAIAEMGALSRLSQAFTVLMMLNPFLVQPVFARVESRRDFQAKLALVVVALAMLSVLSLTSAYVAPHWWLFLLGAKYAGLVQELPIAIGAALATVIGGTLYTVVIARGETRGQSLAVVPCLGGQVAYIAINGAHVTSDALILGLIPALAYAAVQAALLFQLLKEWPATDHIQAIA